MIKFDELKETEIPEFKGGKGIVKAHMFMDDHVKIMKSTLEKGCSIGEHTHTTSCEVVYVLSGEAKCTIDGRVELIKAGQCHYCPKGSTHSVVNEKDEPLISINVVPEQ